MYEWRICVFVFEALLLLRTFVVGMQNSQIVQPNVNMLRLELLVTIKRSVLLNVSRIVGQSVLVANRFNNGWTLILNNK